MNPVAKRFLYHVAVRFFLYAAYNIINDKQIPDISRFSPVSQVIGIRPGQVCRIDRTSKTAINTQ